MPDKWTGRLIGKMHNERVSYEELGEKLGVTKSYVSMVLNGIRKPPKARERFEQAFEEVLKGRR